MGLASPACDTGIKTVDFANMSAGEHTTRPKQTPPELGYSLPQAHAFAMEEVQRLFTLAANKYGLWDVTACMKQHNLTYQGLVDAQLKSFDAVLEIVRGLWEDTQSYDVAGAEASWAGDNNEGSHQTNSN